MLDLPRELAARRAAFDWLRQQVDLFGDVLPRELLATGFEFEGQRIPLLSPQGIFTPKVLELPISITTVLGGPYDDGPSPDGFALFYRYRGNDPNHRDNVLLRRTMELGIPLCYFLGVVPGRYLAEWPAFVQADHPAARTFTVAVDDVAGDAPPRSRAPGHPVSALPGCGVTGLGPNEHRETYIRRSQPASRHPTPCPTGSPGLRRRGDRGAKARHDRPSRHSYAKHRTSNGSTAAVWRAPVATNSLAVPLTTRAPRSGMLTSGRTSDKDAQPLTQEKHDEQR